jgi:tripartite-type tricarboxylate transporter receptor subunit TctC
MTTAILATAFACAALAADYPAQLIRLIVPFTPA